MKEEGAEVFPPPLLHRGDRENRVCVRPKTIGVASQHAFTTVELLVVALVVAVLAAVAIPTFLHQRARGHRTQVEAGLKNGANAMESYAASADGDYSGATIALLEANEGLNIPSGVTLSLPPGSLSDSTYCLQAGHSDLTGTWHYSKAEGALEPGAC